MSFNRYTQERDRCNNIVQELASEELPTKPWLNRVTGFGGTNDLARNTEMRLMKDLALEYGLQITDPDDASNKIDYEFKADNFDKKNLKSLPVKIHKDPVTKSLYAVVQSAMSSGKNGQQNGAEFGNRYAKPIIVHKDEFETLLQSANSKFQKLSIEEFVLHIAHTCQREGFNKVYLPEEFRRDIEWYVTQKFSDRQRVKTWSIEGVKGIATQLQQVIGNVAAFELHQAIAAHISTLNPGSEEVKKLTELNQELPQNDPRPPPSPPTP